MDEDHEGGLFPLPSDNTEPVEPTLSLAERFQLFDQGHPHVFETLRTLAYDYKRRTGRDRVGVSALWERMRWELSVQTGETPVLNNSYRSFFARKLMLEPGLEGLFETRRSVADEWTPGARAA